MNFDNAWSDGYNKGFIAGFQAAQKLNAKTTKTAPPDKPTEPSKRGRPAKIFDPTPPPPGNRGATLRMADIVERLNVSKSSVYRMMYRGTFPKPYKLSDRIVAWDEKTVDDWLLERKKNEGRA